MQKSEKGETFRSITSLLLLRSFANGDLRSWGWATNTNKEEELGFQIIFSYLLEQLRCVGVYEIILVVLLIFDKVTKARCLVPSTQGVEFRLSLKWPTAGPETREHRARISFAGNQDEQRQGAGIGP